MPGKTGKRSARGDAGFDGQSLRADIVFELDEVTVQGLRINS